MLSKELYTPEQIRAVPSLEIARHMARVARLEYALDQCRQTDARTTSDWGSEDGRIIQTIVETLPTFSSRNQAEHYDFGVLYAMTARRPVNDINKAHPVKTPDPRKNIGYQMIDLERQLAFDGYERVGELFEDQTSEYVPTIGAFAAGALRRASIKHQVDRDLYDRHEEIIAARKVIEAIAPERFITREVEFSAPTKRGWKRQTRKMTDSVYTYGFNPASENGRPFETQWWWNELDYDLDRIDRVAQRL